MLPTMNAAIGAQLRFDDRRIIIVGAGGWLGMATLELLHLALGDQQFDARVVCFGARARALELRSGKTVAQHVLAELSHLPPCPSFLLHLAFLTKDKALEMDEAAYCEANRALSQMIRAALDKIGVEGAFVASSGAAYSAHDPRADDALRLYGALKCEDENTFSAWAHEANKVAIITRVFNVSGRYISQDKPYALFDFIRCALDRQPIVVRAPRRIERGYVAIRELLSLVFAFLLHTSRDVVRFDTGGQAIELLDLARVVADIAAVPVERAPITERDANHYVGDGIAYAALLSKFNIAPVSLTEQVRETYDYLAGAI